MLYTQFKTIMKDKMNKYTSMNRVKSQTLTNSTITKKKYLSQNYEQLS